MQQQQHGGTGCHLPGGRLAKLGVAQQSNFILSFLWREKQGGALPGKVMHALTRSKGFFAWPYMQDFVLVIIFFLVKQTTYNCIFVILHFIICMGMT